MASPESLEAFHSGDKDKLRAIVYSLIRQRRTHGTTDDEISQALGLVPNSVAPRRTELEDAGSVVKLFDGAGNRVRRKTRQGCSAGVYVAFEFATRITDSRAPKLNQGESLFGDLTSIRRYDDRG